jgi:hypothetical protein
MLVQNNVVQDEGTNAHGCQGLEALHNWPALSRQKKIKLSHFDTIFCNAWQCPDHLYAPLTRPTAFYPPSNL